MLKIIPLTVCYNCICVLFVCAQNLVPNGSFEENTNCNIPKYWTYISFSPDYFSSCNSSVPKNSFGYQKAATGNSYIGLYNQSAYTISNYREIIGCKLIDSLNAGQKYFVSIKVSLANCTNCATNNIGLLFSKTPFFLSNPISLPNNTLFYSKNIITDTTNWIIIAGSFISDSTYKYISIGNFFDNNHTTSQIFNWNSCFSVDKDTCVSYYYIDDVCVSTDSSSCNNNLGNTIKLDNINLELFPNPSSNRINIKSDIDHNFECTIISSIGEKIKTIEIPNTNYLDVSDLSDGIYFLEFKSLNTTFFKKQIIVH